MDKSNIFSKAEKKVKSKKAALISIITWAAFAIFFIFLDLTTDGSRRLEWAFYPIFFWGLGVFFQSMSAFDFFGWSDKWEKEELRKEIEKRRKEMSEYSDPSELDSLDLNELRELRQEYKDSDFV